MSVSTFFLFNMSEFFQHQIIHIIAFHFSTYSDSVVESCIQHLRYKWSNKSIGPARLHCVSIRIEHVWFG